MIKLVASDLDGTLLLHKAQSLPEEIFSLIRQLEELGIMFVAASGRQYPNMTKLFAPVTRAFFITLPPDIRLSAFPLRH